jgi:hypothetical protein
MMIERYFFVAVLVSVMYIYISHASADEEVLNRKLLKNSKMRRSNPNNKALEDWVKFLDPKIDYNTTMWKIATRSSTWSVHFNEYAKKLSAVFDKAHAKVNFVMIGACDGTSDNTIRELFLPNDHWRGVFVGLVYICLSSFYFYLVSIH